MIILQLFGQLNSVNIDCDFNSNWDYMILHNIYRCELQNNLYITSPLSAQITSVTGTHYDWKSSNDVVGFDSREKSMEYFPRGLDNFFKNLKSIVIYYGRIKEIHQSDLAPFYKLVNLYLDNNDIQILEAGLFDSNPNLQGVSFLGNRITIIDTTIFDNLPKLENIWLSENLCINMDATNSYSGVRNVIKQAKTLCSGNPSEPDTKSCADRCDFQNGITESLTAGMKSMKTSVDDLHASFEEQKASESGKCQINFNEKIENLESRFESFENKTGQQLDKIEKEFEASQNNILSSVDEKLKEIEGRLADKIEEILEKKLKKNLEALNIAN